MLCFRHLDFSQNTLESCEFPSFSNEVAQNTMWKHTTESINERTLRYSFFKNESTLSYSEAIRSWKEDKSFRNYFFTQLKDCPYSAFRWETPAVITANVQRPFEYVILESNSLDRSIDSKSFSEKFERQNDVVTFSNLSGDATLVVPCPVADESIYGHLGSFVRNAPESQLHSLWIAVGDAMANRISDQPVWLSTAGMGVSWLHVRLDSRPKYYAHSPYRIYP